MKVFLILWAVGLATCDKLDRTYLPPPGFHTAGGSPGDIDLPLEFPKENYPSTLGPEISITTNSKSLGATFPNVAIGIDRQGPPVSSVTSAGYFTTGPGSTPSKRVFNVPTTTTSYAFAQTTPLSPVESYETTVGPVVNQEYPSYYNGYLKYPQFSSQQIINSNTPQKSDLFFPNVPTSLLPNVGESFSSNIFPQDFSSANYTSQLGDNFEDTSEITIPTENISYPTYYNENQSSVNKPHKNIENLQYSTKQTSEDFDGVNVHSTDLYGPTNIDISSKLVPMSSSPSAVISSEYSSSPLSNNLGLGYNTVTQPERIQAQSDRNATTLDYHNILSPEGFSYSYNTSNGIHAHESGTAIDGVKAEGSYSYTGDDGKVYRIIYTADENGFLPRGDHLPTAPPIPDAILKVIEQAMQNKQSGITDDGSYDAVKYGHERYEGHIPRNHIENFIKSKPAQKKGPLNNKIISYQNGDVPARSSNLLHQIHIEDYSNTTANHPYIINTDNNIKKYDYTNEDHKNFMPNDVNRQNSNGLLSPDKTVNYLINKPKSAPINADTEGNSDLNRLSATGKGPTANNVFEDIENREDIYQPSYTGYEYSHPQKLFNYDNGNNSEFGFSNLTREKQPEVVINNDATTAKPFITPNVSFKFKSANVDDPAVNLRPSIQNFALQSQTDTVNGFQPKIPPFYNGRYETANNGQKIVTDRHHEPEYESTSSEPYNHQYPYTSNVLEKERDHYYPTTTFGSEYSPATTVMPSSTTRTTYPVNRSNYQQTSPIVSQFTSTLKPSITSKMPGSITQRPFNDNRILSTKPDVSVNKINGRPRLRNRPKPPGNYNGGDGLTQIPTDSSRHGLETKFGLLDPSSQNRRISSRPNNYESKSSTERIIGEEFSGPKQPQGFNPKQGYYY